MKRVILRVMMLVAMASAAVTMSVHTSSKEVKASEKGDAAYVPVLFQVSLFFSSR